MKEPPLKIIIAGHVDHGKSTLIGRLLHDTDSLAEGRIEELKAASAQRGVPFEWSFALDALQAERDQAVTIDTARVWLNLPGRDALLIDAPGHREFLAKMLSGAAAADAAVLVVDAAEGMQEQTRRHAHLLRLLGITRIAVAINKMDLAGYDEKRFRTRAEEMRGMLSGLGLSPSAIIPVAAPEGDNLARTSPRMPWHPGPPLTEVLDGMAPAAPPLAQPLRLPIQDVYRMGQRRLYVGRIESGRLRIGDEVLFSPSNKTARVQSVELWPATPTEASAGQSVGITLDRPLFVERGEVASHVEHAPLLSHHFRATLVWLGTRPPERGRLYRMQLGTTETPVTLEKVEHVVDTAHSARFAAAMLMRDEIGEVVLRSARMLALDDADRLPRTGRLVLRDAGDLVAGGLVRLDGIPDRRPTSGSAALVPVAHRVTGDARAHRFGHKGGVLWFTGLSGAGKSTLAMAVEEHLFRKGYAVYVLDGDNVRGGLNADLGFSPDDRVENIRRVGEAAALFADAGLICITAFISPYAADRARARAAAGPAFHEVYVSANLATCEERDPKGLYRRARAGELAEFTGISAPYEPPAAPEVIVDTAGQPVDACVALVLAYVDRHFAIDATDSGAS